MELWEVICFSKDQSGHFYHLVLEFIYKTTPENIMLVDFSREGGSRERYPTLPDFSNELVH